MYNGLVSFEHAGIHNYNNMQYCNTISAQNTAQVLTSQTSFWDRHFLMMGFVVVEKQPFYKISLYTSPANMCFVGLGLGIHQALGIMLFS